MIVFAKGIPHVVSVLALGKAFLAAHAASTAATTAGYTTAQMAGIAAGSTVGGGGIVALIFRLFTRNRANEANNQADELVAEAVEINNGAENNANNANTTANVMHELNNANKSQEEQSNNAKAEQEKYEKATHDLCDELAQEKNQTEHRAIEAEKTNDDANTSKEKIDALNARAIKFESENKALANRLEETVTIASTLMEENLQLREENSKLKRRIGFRMFDNPPENAVEQGASPRAAAL